MLETRKTEQGRHWAVTLVRRAIDFATVVGNLGHSGIFLFLIKFFHIYFYYILSPTKSSQPPQPHVLSLPLRQKSVANYPITLGENSIPHSQQISISNSSFVRDGTLHPLPLLCLCWDWPCFFWFGSVHVLYTQLICVSSVLLCLHDYFGGGVIHHFNFRPLFSWISQGQRLCFIWCF